MNGTKKQRDMVNDAVRRWWDRVLMLFGPPDSDSVHDEKLRYYRLKIKSNDELRQSWLTLFVPRIQKMGVEIPDPTLRYDEKKGRWIFREPDWSELKKVRDGILPARQRRLKQFQEMYSANQWVREIVQKPELKQVV